jgi:sugar O-acyltransferase (sialic acid O-acetyltransferase NeuD family)
MVIIGAKGFAKEVLEIFSQRNELHNLFFFDNVSQDIPDKLYGRFPVLRTVEEVKRTFENTGDNRFTLGLGNPVYRFRFNRLITEAGGELVSTISPHTDIGSFGTSIAPGCNILSGTIITNDVTLKIGCLINPGCTISHDSILGDFVQVSPGARITGNCQIGNYSQLGTNSVILPRIKVGVNVIVGAGAVVTKDAPDNSMLAGVPAVVKKKLKPLEF